MLAHGIRRSLLTTTSSLSYLVLQRPHLPACPEKHPSCSGLTRRCKTWSTSLPPQEQLVIGQPQHRNNPIKPFVAVRELHSRYAATLAKSMSTRPVTEPSAEGDVALLQQQLHQATIEDIKAKFRAAEPLPTSSSTQQQDQQVAAAPVGCIDLLVGNAEGVTLGPGVACLRINSPARRNALTGRMMAELSDVLTRLEAWTEGRALILYGTSGFFCSGGDLNTVRDSLVGPGNEEGGTLMATLMQDNLRRLDALPLVSVSLVRGKALGGGSELAVATDFRVMTPEAEVGFVHVRMAITPGWGGGSRLVHLVGATRALELMGTGRRVGAAEALSLGLSQATLGGSSGGGDASSGKTLSDEEALRETLAWLDPFLGNSTESGPRPASPLRAIKGIVHAAKWLPLDAALAREAELFVGTWGAAAHLEALGKNVKHRD